MKLIYSFSLLISLLLSACGGMDIEYETDKLYMKGKVITFESKMYYVKCEGEIYQGLDESLFLLVREKTIHIYDKCKLENVEGIRKDMKYRVSDSFLKIPWGFYKPFNSVSRYLVLQDEEGKKSMFSDSILRNSNARIR